MEKPEILYKFFPIKTVEDAYLLTNAIVGYSDKNNIKFLDYIELDKLTAPFYQQNNCVIMANGRSVDDALEHPLIRFFKLRFGIIPLFANCSNYYVWDRYAGGYDSLFYNGEFNGMCIGLKTNGVFKEAKKVEYVDKPKVIDITEKFNKFKDYFKKDNISYEDEEYKELFNALKDEVKESFFYKSKYWRHEQEYRIVKEFPYLNEQEEFELIEEIINADFGEIASVDKCYKEANNDILFENSHFFMYSHEEIACLITGCNLHRKILKIFNKHVKQCIDDRNDFIKLLIKFKIVLEKAHENEKNSKEKINTELIKIIEIIKEGNELIKEGNETINVTLLGLKLYFFLGFFFNNETGILKELNEEFYEKFKNIDFKYLEEVKDNDRFYELH